MNHTSRTGNGDNRARPVHEGAPDHSVRGSLVYGAGYLASASRFWMRVTPSMRSSSLSAYDRRR